MHVAKGNRTSRSGNHFGRAVYRCMARLAGVAATVLLFAGIVVHDAQSQAQPLGDHYIFFVDGVNPDLDRVDGAEVVNDPDGSDNKVLKLNHGEHHPYQGFRFDGADGRAHAPRDMTANRDAGNVLHFRMLVDEANAESGGDLRNLAIQLEDFSAYIEGQEETGNLPFRLRWIIPADMRNGEWHEVSVVLPPANLG